MLVKAHIESCIAFDYTLRLHLIFAQHYITHNMIDILSRENDSSIYSIDCYQLLTVHSCMNASVSCEDTTYCFNGKLDYYKCLIVTTVDH